MKLKIRSEQMPFIVAALFVALAGAITYLVVSNRMADGSPPTTTGDVTPISASVVVPPYIVSSTTAYDSHGSMEIDIPEGVQQGDLLLLFLSRTDDVLPIEIASSDWEPVASCLKEYNEQSKCATVDDCIEGMTCEKDGYTYCRRFRIEQRRKSDGHIQEKDVDGRDLATAVFAKFADEYDLNQTSYEFNLDGIQPAWSILSAVRNAALDLRGYAGSSCDEERQTIFPSVYAKPDDLLLLHMAFDDTASMDDFIAPIGAHLAAYTWGSDEAGFLFQENITKAGHTGFRVTGGSGGHKCKDENLSIVIKPREEP